MASTIGPLRATLTLSGVEPAIACLTALAEIAQKLVDAGKLSLEGGGINLDDLIALRADGLLVSAEPTQCCLDLVATISALELGGHFIRVDDRHGWPILSCGVATMHDSRTGSPGNRAAGEVTG